MLLIFAKTGVALVALEHLYILYLEMFAWNTLGKKVFKNVLPDHLFEPTKGLAANQGLYNGFLAAGLFWTFFITEPLWQCHVALFFLGCIAVAGIYGAVRSSGKIFFIQALPAIITMVLMLLSQY